MRFMMLVYPGPAAETGALPTQKDIELMTGYNEELTKAGVLLALDGLHPTSDGVRVHFPGGKPVVTDGPFAEAKEIVGGYWLIQTRSKDGGDRMGLACPAPCRPLHRGAPGLRDGRVRPRP